MAIKKDTLDGLLAGRDPQAVFAKDGLFDELKKALAERVLNAEIDDHLDGEAAAGKRNSRNGYSKKTVLTETSKLDLRIPRDREGTFDPKLIARYQRRFPGFDEKIVSMYARGMTVREIQGHLAELYGARGLARSDQPVTDAVLDDGRRMAEPAARPDLSGGVSSTRCGSKSATRAWSRNKAVYVALGAHAGRRRRTFWAFGSSRLEGAKFWLQVMNELKNRGVNDILIAVVDGLKGFPEAIAVGVSADHGADLHRASDPQFLAFASWKDRKAILRTQGDLPGDGHGRGPRRRSRISTPAVGPQVSGDRPELAAQLGARHPVLRLSRRGAAHHLHHERDRSLEREAAARRENARPFSDR